MKTFLFIPFLFIFQIIIGQVNPAEIIGKPFRIGNLEVAKKDFPKKMNWIDANKACADLGKGWRLPTKDELNLIYKNKDKIGGFAINQFWSSTEYDTSQAWLQAFDNGSQDFYIKGYEPCVRAVRSF
jgi:hypothetical protein